MAGGEGLAEDMSAGSRVNAGLSDEGRGRGAFKSAAKGKRGLERARGEGEGGDAREPP